MSLTSEYGGRLVAEISSASDAELITVEAAVATVAFFPERSRTES